MLNLVNDDKSSSPAPQTVFRDDRVHSALDDLEDRWEAALARLYRRPIEELSRPTSPWGAWLIALWTVAVAVLGFVWSPLWAVRFLAVSLVLYGIAAAVLPEGIVPRVRSRVTDPLVCFFFAATLAFFSQWATTPMIG